MYRVCCSKQMRARRACAQGYISNLKIWENSWEPTHKIMFSIFLSNAQLYFFLGTHGSPKPDMQCTFGEIEGDR